jgi:hypothetical protein
MFLVVLRTQQRLTETNALKELGKPRKGVDKNQR